VQRPDKPSNEMTARLRAGPDKGSGPARHRGFRVAHRTAAQQIGWMLKQADRNGFTIRGASRSGTGTPGCCQLF
jgi:CRISPR system Cascade subunit CasE